MKKIVALVLSLVMVLGLATTAFAVVSSTTTMDGEDYSVYALGNTDASIEDVDITKTVTGESTETKDGETTVTYTATSYKFANGFQAIEVAPSFATHKLVDENGAIVAYLLKNVASATTTDVVDSVVAAVEEPACGEYKQNAAANQFVVYVVDDVAYYGDSAANGYAVLNGQFVGLGTKATAVDHKYKAATFSTAKHTDVETVKCTECGETWDVLSVAEVAGLSPKAFKQVSVDVAGKTEKLYIAVAANVVVAPEATDKVESAETFDAGIAMYVGMSVMAAAGSAVVLKKKD